MKQFKGLLLCNEEQQSSLIKNLNRLLVNKNINFEQMIFGFDQFNELSKQYDIILLAPYFSFYYEKYILIAKKYQIQFLKLTNEEYENKNIDLLIKKIISILKI